MTRYLAPAVVAFAGYLLNAPALRLAALVIVAVMVARERPPSRVRTVNTASRPGRWGIGAGIGIGPFVVGLYRRIGRG